MADTSQLLPLIRQCGVGQDKIVMTEDPRVSICKECDRCVVAVSNLEEFSIAKSHGDCVEIRIPGQSTERGSSIVEPPERPWDEEDIPFYPNPIGFPYGNEEWDKKEEDDIPFTTIVGNPLGDEEWGPKEESR